MNEISAEGRKSLNQYSNMTKPTSKMHTPKFQVGQTVKSELGKFKGVIIKITPNASACHTDMYTIRTNKGKREFIEESFLELDEIVASTQINGIDTDVIIDKALDKSDFEPQFIVSDYVHIVMKVIDSKSLNF